MRREFPDQALVGVGGVVIHRNRVLLVRRGGEPLKGQWSLPGGLIELGETLTEGVQREIKEETGLEVEPLEVIEVFDRITRVGSRVQYHYVIVDYACRCKRGHVASGSDVVDACWVKRDELHRFELTEKATSVILKGFEFFRRRKWHRL